MEEFTHEFCKINRLSIESSDRLLPADIHWGAYKLKSIMRKLAFIIISVGAIFAFAYSNQFCYGSEDMRSKDEKLIRAYMNEYERPDGYFIVGENERKALVIENEFTSEEGLSLAHLDESKLGGSFGRHVKFPREKIFLEHDTNNILIAHTAPHFSEDLGVVRLYSGKSVVIDKIGRFAIPPSALAEYYTVGAFFEGRAIFTIYPKLTAQEEAKAKLNALHVGDQQKKDILTTDIAKQEKMLAIQQSLMVGCIDTHGKKLFSSTKYASINRYSEHMAVVRLKGQNKFGFIDCRGDLAIPARFDSASDFHDGLALVKQGELYGFIDHCGKFLIDPAFKNARSFFDALAAVQIKGKWGYINQKGQLAIQPTFKWAGDYSEGLAPASLDCEQDRDNIFDDPLNSEKCHYGYIDTSGKFKLPPRFTRVFPFRFGIAKVWEPADIATKAFFFAFGFLVPAHIPIVERYIDKSDQYLQSYKELK